MIHFLVTAGQDHSVREYLARRGDILADRFDVLHYEDLPERSRFERGTYILSALEYLSRPMLAFVSAIHARLAGVEGFRFLNDPGRTLQRFDLLRALERRGYNPFRAVRAVEDLAGLTYPVFLRAERSHDGAVSPLLRSPREVEAALGRALLVGRRIEDLLVVEFCDTADDRGYYRKYGAFVVGDRIIGRRLDYGRAWMLKREHSEFSPEMGREEFEYVRANPHEAALREIAELAAVGYGCIDYGIKDGRVVVWEINLAPTMGPTRGVALSPKTPEYKQFHAQTADLFHARMREAFEVLDHRVSGSAVEVVVDAALIRAARASANELPASSSRLYRAFGRVRPVIEPLAAPLLPYVGRMARRSRRMGRARA
jgi:hypothetical protein